RPSPPLSSGKASLFPNASTPSTPAANAHPNEFFAQIQPSAPPHFITRHPRTLLVRRSSYGPDCGRGPDFNQPSFPPEMILASIPTPQLEKHTRQGLGGAERKKWGLEWSIEPAEQGNGGLFNAIRAAQRTSNIDILWLGTVGFPTDELEESTK